MIILHIGSTGTTTFFWLNHRETLQIEESKGLIWCASLSSDGRRLMHCLEFKWFNGWMCPMRVWCHVCVPISSITSDSCSLIMSTMHAKSVMNDVGLKGLHVGVGEEKVVDSTQWDCHIAQLSVVIWTLGYWVVQMLLPAISILLSSPLSSNIGNVGFWCSSNRGSGCQEHRAFSPGLAAAKQQCPWGEIYSICFVEWLEKLVCL